MNDNPNPEPPESGAKPTGDDVKQAAQQQVERAKEYLMRFGLPQRLMLVGSGLAFLLGFLNWYAVKTPLGSHGVNGFAPWHGKLFFLTSLGTVLLLTVSGIRDAVLGKQSPQNRRLIFLGLVGVSLIFGPVWFMMSVDEPAMPVAAANFSIGKTMWFWLALLAAGTAAAGGFMAMKEDA